LVKSADREATVKGCGVAVAMLQGHSWAPTLSNGSEWTWEPSRRSRLRPAACGPELGRPVAGWRHRDGTENP